MAKDPAFLFYPGDYLRDTQNLSEKSQVAYDRIMCEHMRNICISKQQLKFFTKKLNEEELEELMFMLIEVEGGYQIEWVAESISKRKDYSESRRKNRTNKKEKENEDMSNISKSYVKHMENENEIENENVIEEKKENAIEKFNFKNSLIELGIENNIVETWLKIRKTKKAVNSEIAFNRIKNEIEKSGRAANDCIKYAVEKSWSGFEAEWINKQQQNFNNYGGSQANKSRAMETGVSGSGYETSPGFD